MGDFDDQVKLSKLLVDIAKTIDKMVADSGLPKQHWSLYVWGTERCNYISNAQREDIKVAMQQVLDRWNDPQDPPPHKFQ